MKIKLQSSSKLRLVAAVKRMLDLGLKEAKDLVENQVTAAAPVGVGLAEFHVVIDSEKTEEQIKAIAEECEVTYTPLSDLDVCERKLQESKLQEVTDDDLGVSIHSIDEMSIGWQRKALFSYKQAARVMAGLRDAKFNVTEANVMYEGQKTTMLVVTKTFPTGTRKKDLEKFEKLLHTFMNTVCHVVDIEERLEYVKELAIDAFDELQDYE